MKIPQVLLIEVQHAPGNLARVLGAVGEVGLTVEGLVMIRRTQDRTTWELTVELDAEDEPILCEKLASLPIATLLGVSDRVFTRHEGGKIRTASRVALDDPQVLRDVYTPGVARVCLAIRDNPDIAHDYTSIGHTVAIVTNGTAILGLGDIGPVAGMPVMEGKAALFDKLAGISGVPILIDERDPARLVETVVSIAPTFGAIQLEDISAPECFEIEDALSRRLDIPVLHDDQHGTAVVVLAALLRAAELSETDLSSSVIAQIGLGAAGIGIARMLLHYGVREVHGADLDESALEHLENLGGTRSDLESVMASADVIIATTGVKGLIKPEMVRDGQLIFALSNPEPEIEPTAALAHGAAFAADGKNLNNVLAFPGLFRGALDAGAKRFTDAMLIGAARAIASEATDDQLIPDPLDPSVHRAVAKAVAEASG